MKRYETIVIINNDVSEDVRGQILQKVEEIISKEKGELINFDHWGARKLAYDIKKKKYGYYVRVDLCGAGQLVSELERFFRIDENVLKYLTVLIDKEANIEKIRQEEKDKEDKLAENVQSQEEASQKEASNDEAEHSRAETNFSGAYFSDPEPEHNKENVPDAPEDKDDKEDEAKA